MDGFRKGEHDLCSVYCAVVANAPIDGLSDREIARHFVAELTDAIEGCEPDELVILQLGLARLLFWLVESDDQPGRGQLAAQLETFLARHGRTA